MTQILAATRGLDRKLFGRGRRGGAGRGRRHPNARRLGGAAATHSLRASQPAPALVSASHTTPPRANPQPRHHAPSLLTSPLVTVMQVKRGGTSGGSHHPGIVLHPGGGTGTLQHSPMRPGVLGGGGGGGGEEERRRSQERRRSELRRHAARASFSATSKGATTGGATTHAAEGTADRGAGGSGRTAAARTSQPTGTHHGEVRGGRHHGYGHSHSHGPRPRGDSVVSLMLENDTQRIMRQVWLGDVAGLYGRGHGIDLPPGLDVSGSDSDEDDAPVGSSGSRRRSRLGTARGSVSGGRGGRGGGAGSGGGSRWGAGGGGRAQAKIAAQLQHTTPRVPTDKVYGLPYGIPLTVDDLLRTENRRGW